MALRLLIVRNTKYRNTYDFENCDPDDIQIHGSMGDFGTLHEALDYGYTTDRVPSRKVSMGVGLSLLHAYWGCHGQGSGTSWLSCTSCRVSRRTTDQERVIDQDDSLCRPTQGLTTFLLVTSYTRKSIKLCSFTRRV